MTRKLKMLGLGLFAALALSAVGASAASADQITSDTGTGVTHLTGTSANNVFAIPSEGLEFACQTSSFSGTFNGAAATQVTVHPTYSGTLGVEPHTTHCNSTLGTVTVDTNTCDYLLTGTTDVTHNGANEGQVHVDCTGTNKIKITSSAGCTIEVPEQTPTQGGVRYTNDVSNTNAVIIDATATGIAWTAHGFVCAIGGIATEGHDATYNGSVTVRGYEAAPHTTITEVDLTVNST